MSLPGELGGSAPRRSPMKLKAEGPMSNSMDNNNNNNNKGGRHGRTGGHVPSIFDVEN